MDKRFLFLMLLTVFAVAPLPSMAGQTVRTYFTYDEEAADEGKWTYGDTDGVITSTGDVTPMNYTFTFATGDKNVLTVHPAKGWVIAAWYCAPHGSGYRKWKVQNGGDSYTWEADAQKDHDGWRDLDLIAAFKPIDYTLSFKANGGQGQMPAETHSYTNVFNLKPCMLTKSSQAFACWTNAATGATFADGALVSGEIFAVSNDDPRVTLTAVWTNCLYKLTFDANGGGFEDGSTSLTVLAEANMPIGELPEPTCPGMRPSGWYTEKAGGFTVDRFTKYSWNQDITLYEQWQEQIYLSVAVQAVPSAGGNASGGGTQFVQGDKTTLSAQANDGYAFAGWSDGGAQVHEITVMRSDTYTATFTGKWYSVSFNAQGGILSEDVRDYQYGAQFGVLPMTEKDGYDFVGWSRKRSGGDLVTVDTFFDFPNPDDADFTLYAQWMERPAYTVSYVSGGATGAMANQTIYRDEETALASNRFARTGYAFLGWAETNDLETVKYTDGQKVTNIAAPNDTNELHAVWQANSFTVAFDGNGATEVTMEPQSFVYDVAQPLRANTFTRGELWSFVGWSNTVDGTVFEDGATVSNLCTLANSTNTLQAVWRSNLTGLSRAMHCTNLIWTGEDKGKGHDWHPDDQNRGATATTGFAELTGDNQTSLMAATGTVSGTLSFKWKANVPGAKLEMQNELNAVVTTWTFDGSTEWQDASIWVATNQDGKAVMRLRINYNTENESQTQVFIDQMTWTPAGGEPKQGEPVAAATAGVDGNIFSLMIPTESGTEYGVWTNADVTVPAADWGLMETKRAEGTTLDFSLEVLSGVPQLFFRAYKVDYK